MRHTAGAPLQWSHKRQRNYLGFLTKKWTNPVHFLSLRLRPGRMQRRAWRQQRGRRGSGGDAERAQQLASIWRGLNTLLKARNCGRSGKPATMHSVQVGWVTRQGRLVR